MTTPAKKITRRAKLTLAYIRAAVAADPRLDPVIDTDEPGKALVNTADGWTWCAMDGNRHVEGFLISADNADEDPQDTVGHFEACRSMIEAYS